MILYLCCNVSGETPYNTMRHVIRLLKMQVHDLRDNNALMALILKNHMQKLESLGGNL